MAEATTGPSASWPETQNTAGAEARDHRVFEDPFFFLELNTEDVSPVQIYNSLQQLTIIKKKFA